MPPRCVCGCVGYLGNQRGVSCVDRWPSGAIGVLGDVRAHVHRPELVYEVLSIVTLVSGDCDGARPIGTRLEHRKGGDPLRMIIRGRDPGVDNQRRAVLHQAMADEAELRLHAGSLAVEPGLGIGRALVRVVRALLALETDLPVAPPAQRWFV